jgi:hypothetical protein
MFQVMMQYQSFTWIEVDFVFAQITGQATSYHKYIAELLKSVGFVDKKSKCRINSVPLSVRMSDKYAILLFSIFRKFRNPGIVYNH